MFSMLDRPTLMLALVRIHRPGATPKMIPSGLQGRGSGTSWWRGCQDCIITASLAKHGRDSCRFSGTHRPSTIVMAMNRDVQAHPGPALPATANLNVTVALALTVFDPALVIGLQKELGPLGWADQLLGSRAATSPAGSWHRCMLPIHVLGEDSAKPDLSTVVPGCSAQHLRQRTCRHRVASLSIAMLPFQLPAVRRRTHAGDLSTRSSCLGGF